MYREIDCDGNESLSKQEVRQLLLSLGANNDGIDKLTDSCYDTMTTGQEGGVTLSQFEWWFIIKQKGSSVFLERLCRIILPSVCTDDECVIKPNNYGQGLMLLLQGRCTPVLWTGPCP